MRVSSVVAADQGPYFPTGHVIAKMLKAQAASCTSQCANPANANSSQPDATQIFIRDTAQTPQCSESHNAKTPAGFPCAQVVMMTIHCRGGDLAVKGSVTTTEVHRVVSG
ncbi:hypothetical protein [Tritonibacter horizontis]|uniref:hypothetical protein n=1 Tax=Tritonibacter horizontis TaxID=1768241 RepID=UPI00104211AB|nr:hypothetical protein [Tritonibacter horizontis]